LIYTFEKKGVLQDVNDEDSVIPKLDLNNYERLRSKERIFAGMIPKLDNAFQALNSGVKKIVIGKAENLQQLIAGTSGTTIINE